MSKQEIEGFFGEAADELDRMKDIHHKNAQRDLQMVVLTYDESQVDPEIAQRHGGTS